MSRGDSISAFVFLHFFHHWLEKMNETEFREVVCGENGILQTGLYLICINLLDQRKMWLCWRRCSYNISGYNKYCLPFSVSFKNNIRKNLLSDWCVLSCAAVALQLSTILIFIEVTMKMNQYRHVVKPYILVYYKKSTTVIPYY